MNIQLINGNFSSKDALDLLTQMIHVKIRYHESKINAETIEEDISMRERRIKELQKDLYELRQAITRNPGNVSMNAGITITD